MDFFEQQDRARRKTKWLVFYFAMAVVCIVVAVYFACLLVFHGLSTQNIGYRVQLEHESELDLWNPTLFLYSALGALAVIGIGTAYRFSSLAAGGRSLAESLGGRLVRQNTLDLDERKLLNVVEEMALASGVPVPLVYVLDSEAGINAFAAGHTQSDAVIGVTRGCMKLLTRDELQGVIAHEFSHILNGDMRLNLRLIGLIFGIMCLAIVGRVLIRTRGRKNPMPLLGLALILIGWVGVFFGRLIQAAVSRQREFLADASAVQFTRNPSGLSGALQKIGGLAQGSQLQSEHAMEASHMFFGNALRPSFLNAFATHPPLDKRIRAIDPAWDGKFRRVLGPSPPVVSQAQQGPTPHRPFTTDRPERISAVVVGAAPRTVSAQSVLPSVGRPTALHLKYADELRASLPDNVRQSAQEPLGATAVIYAILISGDPNLQVAQLAEIKNRAGEQAWQKVVDLLPDVRRIAARARLPLVDLALPTLRELTKTEYERFASVLQWLVESDEKIDLFEYALQRVAKRHLESQFEQSRSPVVQYYAIRTLLPDCEIILSAMAHLSSTQSTDVVRAFEAGAPYLRVDAPVSLLPREKCGIAAIDEALNRLALAAPIIKKNLLEACARVVGADGVIHEQEAELLRAIADTLECPIPPFVELETGTHSAG
ncbi:MAG: M48 family metallopeptidase [Verrucomicrobiia bacterium]